MSLGMMKIEHNLWSRLSEWHFDWSGSYKIVSWHKPVANVAPLDEDMN